MSRVQAAIQESRCVVAFGAKALQDVETLGELRRRGGIPAVVLSGPAVSPAVVPSTGALAPALTQGGVLVLVEPESLDDAGLDVLAAAVSASPHKPRLVIVARAFNPFALPGALRMLKFDHEKARPKAFLSGLPVLAAVAFAAPVAEPKKKAGGAPRMQFVGREEELASLKAMIEAGGPVVVHGPHGVGRRWLVEQALAGTSYDRHPDFFVGWGSEADTLFARIAMAGEKAGDGRLAEALRTPAKRPVPSALAALAADTFGKLDNAVLVVADLERVLRRDGTFHREGRFELLLRALLLGTGRVVFLSTLSPRFYREGEGAGLKDLALGGLKGRELHEIFDAYRVEDFDRGHFGDIVQRVHGHPFAARMFAIAVRDPAGREDLLGQARFMRMEDVSDLEPVKRRVQKQMEGLSDEERAALVQLAHFRLPYTSADADVVKIDRNVRLGLQARGLLDQYPESAGAERTWRVHPLVGDLLPQRETSDFNLLEAIGNHFLDRAGKAEGLKKLSLAQEGNRMLFEAHRVRDRMRMPFPDNDGAVESVRGLLRGKRPHPELADQRIGEVLKQDPANTEMLLLRAELRVGMKANNEAIHEAFAAAQAVPTPEAFHLEANLYLARAGGRGRAATCLERACVAFPESGRFKRRLAGVYVEMAKLEDAIRVLRDAGDLEPMMPDTYGLLGEILMQRGASQLAAAEDALQEARRLDPTNALHMARHGALMVERGNLSDEAAAEAEALLVAAIQADSKNVLAHLYLGRLLLDRGGDLERADWALKKASKLEERAAMPLVLRARVSVRTGQFQEAQAMLERALKLDGGCHEAFHARGELAFALGNPFVALSEFQTAVMRSPKDSLGRVRYEADVARMKVLIESGAYVELQRQQEEARAAAESAGASVDAAAETAPRASVRRRRRRGGGGGEVVAEGDAVAEGEAAVEGGDAAEAFDANGGELPVTEVDALPVGAGDAVLAEAEAAGFEPSGG